MKVCISSLALALALGSANASAILQGDPIPVPGPSEDDSTQAYWEKYNAQSVRNEEWIKVCRQPWEVNTHHFAPRQRQTAVWLRNGLRLRWRVAGMTGILPEDALSDPESKTIAAARPNVSPGGQGTWQAFEEFHQNDEEFIHTNWCNDWD
ncbi:hypothetical protein Purlil1_5667 [Purpureocillium lilacinum]|uniref:Uncharacterized protein n=1 Tax=Purpureocillium lilacinum TaxID=33203 RepID=A0ABR0C123_PURLI|nr:hypothetical protein Purlil1_5667 [Purpureocillium lilacinum]